MDQNLKTILDFIQHNENLSAEEKALLVGLVSNVDKELSITTFKLDRTEKVKRTTAILLEETIAELEQKRKAVEIQNRELEIESSLERVRTIAMSMKKRDDMLDVCKNITFQLQSLGVKDIRNVQTAIFYEERGTYMNYEYYAKHDKTFITETVYTNHEIAKAFAEKMLKGKGEVSITLIKGEENVKEWLAYQKTTNVFIDTFLETASSLNYYWFSLGPVALGISTYSILSDTELGFFKRFLNVFELAYRRYLDIEQAEFQARESQIELALERVRARTMAMLHSDELAETVAVMFEQFKALGEEPERMAIEIVNEKEHVFDIWATQHGGSQLSELVQISLDEPHVMKKMYKAWKEKTKSITIDLQGNELEAYFQFLKKAGLPVQRKIFGKRRVQNVATFSKGILTIITPEPRPQETIQLLERFAAVFDGTYTRFFDLQKAEAQAREAQIEAALERVRSASLAMHHSEQLEQVVVSIFERFVELGLSIDGAGIFIFDKVKRNIWLWIAAKHLSTPALIDLPYDDEIKDNAIIKDLWNAIESGGHIFNKSYTGETKNDYFRYVTKYNELKVPESVRKIQIEAESWTAYFAAEKNAIVGFDSWSGPITTITDSDYQILLRFAKVFDQAYIRFLDLQKAEAQAREAKIEAALEKVRSRSLAMHRSEELKEVMTLMFQKLTELNVLLGTVAVQLADPITKDCIFWLGNDKQDAAAVKLPYDKNVISEDNYMRDFWEARNSGVSFFNKVYSAEQNYNHFQYVFANNDVDIIPPAVREFILSASNHLYCLIVEKNSTLVADNYDNQIYTEDRIDVLKRTAKVFDQAYVRFLDLQKAEAQAREAQIEAALERVRAASLSMMDSTALGGIIYMLYRELTKLDAKLDRCFIMIVNSENKGITWWMAGHEGLLAENGFFVQMNQHPSHLWYLDCWLKHRKKWKYLLEGTEKRDQDLFSFNETELSRLPEYIKKDMSDVKKIHLSGSSDQFGSLVTGSFEPLPEEQQDIISRFAIVFNQAYTRFQDLQKAEAQAREAQIQLALERVRARTMAMQHSGELREIAAAVHDQILGLGFTSGFCSIVIMDKVTGDMTWWMFFPGKEYPESYHMPYWEHPFYLAQLDRWKQGEKFSVIEVAGEEKKSYDKYTFSQTEFVKIPIETQQFMMSFEKIIFSNAYMKHGAFSWGVEPIDDAHAEVLQRFAKVFDQSYTRFLDLQKAEAQAREAQIEAALERVRSRTMAMQHSEDLTEVAKLLFQQVQALGVPAWSCGFNIWEQREKCFTGWMSSQGILQPPFKIPLSDIPTFNRFYESRQKGELFYVEEMGGDTLVAQYQYMRGIPGFGEILDDFLKSGFSLPAFQINHVVNFLQGNLIFITSENVPEAHDIFKRFAKVFEQTYTRFLDLQKAEAQAREATKRASVDRVRAEIASMRTTKDLERITPLIWSELTTLAVPFIRSGVFIMDEAHQQVQVHLSSPDGKAIAAFQLNYQASVQSRQIVSHWREMKVFKDHMDEAAFAEYTKNLVQQGALAGDEKYVTENHPTDLYLHFLPFAQGMLYVGNSAPLKEEELQLVQDLADAFSTAYARYEDFNKLEAAKLQVDKALVNLKQAQQQLVQSEKMASLGELTAGIAHEIQNPLNFVNNFSEVSSELVDEMNEELNKGNVEDAKEIATDLKQNLEKITHHGKRAGEIVKGMLQHSRTSSGQKELTDLNVLADEYLRLAYHGLRAKDKSFNSKMETDFDPALPKIEVVPQDIGRVILNLITNAFYVVNEKAKQGIVGYEPTVSVSTKKKENAIEISVKDNGNGIPEHIKEKIFQPFFTTKPTGQGTGLGLSLSYDIVKAHGGELNVETKDGEGSEFSIELPALIS